MPFGATELGRAYIVVTADPKRLYASLEGIKGRTAALAASIERSFGGLRRSFRHLGAGLAEIEAGFSRLARAVAPFAIAVGGLSGLGIKLAADFERAMADVAAVLGKPIDAIQDLTEYAKRMGIETVFSAREAAEAMYYLASAGYDAKEIMAALRPALDLAAATQADLAFATETVVTALAGFRYESDEAARVANTFAAAISGSQATIEKLGHSMRYVGPIAASLGWQIEDVVAVLGKLYDAGLRGEQAGTALRGMLAALMHPVGQTEKALEELGISSAALAEALKNPITLLALLQKHLVDTETGAIDVRNAVRLVGREAGPALAALLSLGVEGLAEFRKQITGTEKASQMAAIQLTAFSAQVKMLMASLEAVALEAFGPLLPIMRTFIEERLVPATNEIARLIREAGGLPGIFARIRESIRAAGFEELVITLGKLIGAFLAFAVVSRVLRPIVGAFLAMGRGVKLLAAGLLTLPAPLKLLIGLAAAFAYAWQRDIGQVRRVVKELWAAVAPALRELGRSFAELARVIGPAMRKLLLASSLLAVQFLHLLVPALQALSPLIIIAAKAISSFAEQMRKAVAEGKTWPVVLSASVFGLILLQSALYLVLAPLRLLGRLLLFLLTPFTALARIWLDFAKALAFVVRVLLLSLVPFRLLGRFLLLLLTPFASLTRISLKLARAITLVVRALALIYIPAALKGLLLILSPLRLLFLGVGRAVLLLIRAFAGIGRVLRGVLTILGVIIGFLSWKIILYGLIIAGVIWLAREIKKRFEAIKERIKGVSEALSDFISDVHEALHEFREQAWDWVVNVSQDIAEDFVWFGHATWSWIVNVAQDIAEDFIWFGHAAWDWIVNVAQDIAEDFVWFGHAAWGWIVNVTQDIAAGFREFSHAAWNWSIRVVQEIASGFREFSARVVKWVIKVIQEFWGAFRDFADSVWKWTINVFQTIAAGFKWFTEESWKWTINVAQTIAAGFKWLADETWTWTVNLVKGTWAKLEEITDKVVTWTINLVRGAYAAVADWLDKTVIWVVNLTKGAWEAVKPWLDKAITWTVNLVRGTWEIAKPWVDKVITWTVNVVKGAWEIVEPWIDKAITWTVNVVKGTWEIVEPWVDKVITWTVNLVKGTWEIAKPWVDKAITWTVNVVKGAWEIVEPWVDKAITWTVNLVRGIWVEIPELADKVFTWTIDIIVRGWQKAKEIFEAIKNSFLGLAARIKAFFTRTVPGFFRRLIFGVEAQAAEAEDIEVAPEVITPEAVRDRFEELLTFLETEFLARWTDAFGGIRESFRLFLDEFSAEGDRFPQIVSDFLDKASSSFADFGTYLTEDFIAIWDSTWWLAEEAVREFSSNLTVALQGVKIELTSFTTILTEKEAVWAATWDRAAQKIEEFAGKVREKLADVIAEVSFLIERVSSIMTENWSPIWEDAKAAVADFASFVQAEMEAARAAVTSFASEAASAITSLGDELVRLKTIFSETIEALTAEPLGKVILDGLQPYIADIGSAFAVLNERISSNLEILTGAIETLLSKVRQAVAAIKELQAAEVPEAPPPEKEEPAEEGAPGEEFTEFQEGGLVPGVGRGDQIPALLEPGELIFSREMVHEHPWLIELYAGLRRGPELLLPTPLISELLEVLPPREIPEEFQVLGEVLEAPEAARITPIATEKLETLRTQVLAWEPDPEQLEKIGWGPEHLESLKENILAFAERLAEQGVPGEEALGILAAIFAGERLPVEIPRGLEPPPIGMQLATQLRDLWDRIRWYPAFLVGPLKAQVELSLGFLREMGYQRGGLADLGRYWGNLLARALVEWWSAFKVLPQLQLGGRVPGAGAGDRIPALLEPGELVFPADIVRRSPWLLALYERLRRPLGFQEGGLVPGVPVERRLEFGVPAVEVEPGFFGRIAEFFTNLFRSIFEMLRDFFTGLFNEIASFFKDIFEEFEVPSEQMGELDEQLAELETAIGKETEAAEARAKASEAETEASEETKESSFDLAAVLAEIEKIERELGETTEGTETKTEASAEALEELENQLEELREIEDPAERARNLTALISQYKDNTAALARIAKEVTRFENELSDTKELLASAGEETAKIDRALEILAGSAEELKSEELATTDQLTDLRERLAEIAEIEDPVERAQQLRTLVGEYQDNIEALSLIGREMRSLRRDLRASGEALAAAGLSAEQVKEALSILEDVSTETVDPLAELGRKLEEIRRIEDPLAQVEKLRELIPLYAGNAEALQVLRREVDSMRGVFQDSRQMLQRAGRSTEQLDAALESLTAASEEIEAALEEGSTALDELAERLERIARIEDPVRRARAYMALMAEYDGQAEALQAIRQEADRFRQGLEELGPALDPERVQEALGVLESASEESSLSILAAAKEQQGALAAAAKETEDALAAFREQLEARLDVRAPLRSIEILRQAIEENAEDVRRLQIVFAVLSEFKGQLETLMRAYALTGRSTGKLSEAIMEAEQLLAARMPAITTELIASAEAGIVALRRLRELAQKHRDEADVLARIVSQHKALEDHLSSLRSELERQRESYAALGLSTAALDAAITALRIELEAASPAVAELQRILAGLDALPLAEAGAAIHDLARAFRDQPEILELIAEKARSLASTLEQEISTREALGLSTQALRKQLEAFWSAVKGTRVEFGYLRDISRRLTETFESAIGRVGDFIRQRIMEKFSSWIKKIIYRLFGLKDSTEELHSAMVNVPQGFKATLQRLRYAVAIPDQPPIEDREENFLDWLKRLIADALILFIEEILGTGFDWLFDFVAAGFSWVFKHALDLLAAAFDFLVELAGGSFGILKEIGGAVLAGVPPMIRQILGALLSALVGWWVKDLTEALGIFEGFAAILGGALVTLIGGVIAGPMGAFAAALVYIAGLLVEAAGGIDALLKAIADAITHVGKLFVDAAIGFVRTLAFIPWLLIKPFEVIFGILKEIPLLGFLFKGIWRTLKDMAAALEGVMPYQEGGLVKRTGLALVHQGEYVLPAGAGLPLETAIDINLEVSSPQPSGVWLRVEDPDVVRKIQDYVRRKNLAWDGSYAGRALVDGAA